MHFSRGKKLALSQISDEGAAEDDDSDEQLKLSDIEDYQLEGGLPDTFEEDPADPLDDLANQYMMKSPVTMALRKSAQQPARFPEQRESSGVKIDPRWQKPYPWD